MTIDEQSARGQDPARRARGRATLSRIAHELIERNADLESLALVGIHTRGVPLAGACAPSSPSTPASRSTSAPSTSPSTATTCSCAPGRAAAPQPVVHGTELDFPLEGSTVVLVDDVLFTGRTIRAAIDALLEYGRPARVQLAVLVDRGHRELPIRPDYVGKNLPTALAERVRSSSRRRTRATPSCCIRRRLDDRTAQLETAGTSRTTPTPAAAT